MDQTGAESFTFEQLYNEHFSTLYRLACHQLRCYTSSCTDASDIVQEVFLLAFRKWDRLREHPNPVGWLMKTTCYVCSNHARARYRQLNKESRSPDAQRLCYSGSLRTSQADDAYTRQDTLLSVEQLLSPDEYRLLKAYCSDRCSMETLCCLTGLSPAALRVRIHRIRRKLTNLLAAAVIIVLFQNI